MRISAAKASINEYEQRKREFSLGADVHNVLQRFAKCEKVTFEDASTADKETSALVQPAAETSALVQPAAPAA